MRTAKVMIKKSAVVLMIVVLAGLVHAEDTEEVVVESANEQIDYLEER